jgi:cellulose synthase/poly-beta-1,6-N-acetylglucosamine synthase-like glycosyltransferase
MALAMLEIACLLVAGVIAFPLAILTLETLASLVGRRKNREEAPPGRPRCAVLVPAYNEELSIAPTVRGLVAQLRAGDRLIVVADNCTDRTAEVARACGATVVERSDPVRRGKGFGLDYGVRYLEADPPEVVVFVDADCALEEGALDRLVRESAASHRPVQAAYVMSPPEGAGLRSQVSGFAFRYKNLVRPLGLASLGLPCLLTGTGIALPWDVVRAAPLASGNIVEDMQLGLDLALAGHPPRFCPEAVVTSDLPAGRRTAAVQRTRWEHGHLRTLLTQVPRLLAAALRQRRIDLLGLALELSVPPLSMLFLLWSAAGLGGVLLGYIAGLWLPALILAGSGLAAALAVFAAWRKFGRAHLSFTSLVAAPVYALGKVPIYVAFLLRPERTWVRTARTPTPAGSSKG